MCERFVAETVTKYEPFNFTSTSDFVKMLLEEFHDERPWFKYRNAKWESIINPPFAEILTNYGFGYTFNLIDKSELLNDET